MKLVENLQSQAKEAREQMKAVEKAADGIIKAIFDSDPTVTYAKASEIYGTISRLMFEEYFSLDYKLAAAKKEGEIK